MPTFRRPTDESISQRVACAATQGPNYGSLGLSVGGTACSTFTRDHYRGRLGFGREVYERAVTGLMGWQMMPRWIEVFPAAAPITAGSTLATVIKVAGLWWVNPTRIIVVMSESGSRERHGFAYGTLPGHAELGEERFLVEWDHADDSVWYDVVAFSKPGHPLARCFRPLARRAQRQFGRDTLAALQQFVDAANS